MQRPKGLGQSMREGQASVWSEFPREDPDHCCRGTSHRPSGPLSGVIITSFCDPVPDPRVSSPSPKQMGSTLLGGPRGRLEGRGLKTISFQIFAMTQSQETFLIVCPLPSLSQTAFVPTTSYLTQENVSQESSL